MRLAPTRLVPFSYFCTCWKVRPNASPSFSWLMPSMIRRMRTRLPTYLSTGLGALVDISSTPWDAGGTRQTKQQVFGEDLGSGHRQTWREGQQRNADNLTQLAECISITMARMRMSAVLSTGGLTLRRAIFAGIQNQTMNAGRQEVRLTTRRRMTKIKAATTMNRGGNVAGAGVNRRRMADGSLESSTPSRPRPSSCDNTSHRIDHGGNAGIGSTHHRQSLLDRAQPHLLQMLIGAGRDSEPAVIGQVDDPARAIVARGNVAGKDRLVADQG